MLGLVSHDVELREEEALAAGRAVVRGPLAQGTCGRLGFHRLKVFRSDLLLGARD